MSSPPAQPPPAATAQPTSAVLPSGALNVDLIQRSVQSDVALEEKYRAEDAMKKRAIHSCQNYDEFRNLVKAAQLKPVNRSEMSSLFNNGGGSLSSNGTQRSGGAAMNKAFSGNGGSGAMDGSGHRGCLGGGLRLFSPDASAAAAERGRRVVAQSSLSQSNQSKHSPGDGGGSGKGSLFDQSTPAELDGLNWNQKATKKSASKSKKKSKKKKKNCVANVCSTSSSISPLQFEKEWKRTCIDPPSTARYLLRTEACSSSSPTASPPADHQRTSKRRLVLQPEDVPHTVFEIELSCDVMGDIVSALAYLCRLALRVHDGGALNVGATAADDGCISEALAALCRKDDAHTSTPSDVDEVARNLRASFIYRWMHAMTQCGRFGLNVSFLTDAQMENHMNVETIFATLEKECGEKGTAYGGEDVLRLRGLYNAS
mmetsp:Transcript_36326/g.79075  ORF Transcript_36326/g.79075 Transcript_36326/m.79075 type:complete len:429 (-) Transcript_36326:1143-2429(-)